MSLPLTTMADPTTVTPDAVTCNSATCSDPTYLLSDHLGSTSITTDVEGNLVSETRYDPWGKVHYASGLTLTDYTYTDQYSYMDDPTTAASEGFGLMFYNARWYDPGLGRFTQADTIVPLQSQGTQAWDRYAFVNNNPVRYNDPTGHMMTQGDDGGCTDEADCAVPPTNTCVDGGWCYPQYTTWNRLRLGSPCTACHVTHWTGTIPTNGEIDPSLMKYYRSMDNFAVAFHGYALAYAGYVAGEAAWLTDPTSIIPLNYRQEVGDAFTSWSMETTSQETVAYRYWSGSGDPVGRYLTTDPSMLPEEARTLLALPSTNSATTVTPIVIPKGTTIIIGGVASQPTFGAYATGGGFQMYVPDLRVLFSLFQ